MAGSSPPELRCARTSENVEVPAAPAFLPAAGVALAPSAFGAGRRGIPSCMMRADATEALMDTAVADASATLAPGASAAGAGVPFALSVAAVAAAAIAAARVAASLAALLASL